MAVTPRKKRELDLRVRAALAQNDMPLMHQFRWKCVHKFGAKGFKELSVLFRNMDTSSDDRLDMKEFVSGVDSLYLGFSKAELKQIFNTLDQDNSGFISISEFSSKMIGEIFPARRKETVDKLFKQIDYDHTGFIETDDLMQRFDFSSHPKFKRGEWTKEQCIEDFVSSFEADGVSDGKISMDEFLCYYAGVSLSIDDDTYFNLELQKSWKNLATKSERQRQWPISDTFALDLTSAKPMTFKKARNDLETARTRPQTARAPTSRENVFTSRSGNTLNATVVVGNKRSLYRSKAPSFMDRSLFGKPRNQQLMESDWPDFKSPFAPDSQSETVTLKWAPTSFRSGTERESEMSVKATQLFIRPKSAAPLITHKVDLAFPEHLGVAA